MDNNNSLAQNGSSAKSTALICLMLVVVGFAIYSGYLGNGWIYDDDALITDSPFYEKPFELSALLEDLGIVLYGEKMGYWRPGQLALYRGEYEVFGLNPHGWHFVAVLLHLICVCAFFLFLKKLINDPKIAAGAALLFMLHPVVTEVVGSNNFQISSAEGALTFFGLLAWLYKRPILAAICVATALGFRESALLMPLLFALFTLLDSRKEIKSALLRLSITVIPVLAYLVINFGFMGRQMLHLEDAPPMLSRMGMIAFASVKALLAPIPANLCIRHDLLPIPIDIALGWIVIVAAVALEGFLVWRAKTKSNILPAILFGACILTAAPYSGVIAPYVIFAEHYLYLPAAFGLATLAAVTMPIMNHRMFTVIFALIVIVFAGISFSRAGLFYDNGQAFKDAVAQYPHSRVARMTLGEFHHSKGEFQLAATQYGEVIKLSAGKHEKAWNNLGDIQFRQGNIDKAITCFEKAGKKGEKNLAIALMKNKEFSKALAILETLALEEDSQELQSLISHAKKSLAQPQ